MLVSVGVGVGVLVSVGVSVGVLVSVGVSVGVLVSVGVRVGVLVSVGVGLGVLVMVGLAVGDGVVVAVLVVVARVETVGSPVAVDEGDATAGTVGVGVVNGPEVTVTAEGVGDGADPAMSRSPGRFRPLSLMRWLPDDRPGFVVPSVVNVTP